MKFLSCQQCREADRIAIEEAGIPSLTLMENAGRGCADAILDMNVDGAAVILCGHGNNGGDGFVIARHLHASGKSVTVILLAKSHAVSGDALTNLERLKTVDIPVIELQPDVTIRQIEDMLSPNNGTPPGVIVDAMLGTGARSGLRPPYNHVVTVANKLDATRVAADLPSGLDGDTGQVANDAFLADLTCTFIAAKHGMNTDNGRRHCGEVCLVDIGIPAQVLARVEA